MNRREFVSLSLGSAFQISRPNPLIERARAAALDLLKPTRSQLEHGLALHSDAVVVDCYGFSPRAAIDSGAFGKAIEAGASSSELDVLSEEMRVLRPVTDAAERAEYMDAWNAAGVTCIVESAGEESQDPMRLIRRMARFTYMTDIMRDFVYKAARPDEITAAKTAAAAVSLLCRKRRSSSAALGIRRRRVELRPNPVPTRDAHAARNL